MTDARRRRGQFAYGRMAPRHPSGFGKPAREAWGDIWPGLEPIMNDVKSGKTVFRDEGEDVRLLTLDLPADCAHADLWLFEVPGHPHKVETCMSRSTGVRCHSLS